MALDVWSYSALIKGYVQNSDLKSALELLQEMKQAHRVLPNEVCYWLSFLSLINLILQFVLAVAVIRPSMLDQRFDSMLSVCRLSFCLAFGSIGVMISNATWDVQPTHS